MFRKYFTERERYQLELLLNQKTTIKEICTILNRSKTCIYREIKNGTVEMVQTLNHTRNTVLTEDSKSRKKIPTTRDGNLKSRMI